MSEEQTDMDFIAGHPFTPSGCGHEWEDIRGWKDICGWEDGDGWICGYARAEHADPGRDHPIDPSPELPRRVGSTAPTRHTENAVETI
jgi:hypothetical protein